MGAEVTRIGMLDMQVCVPKDWTDKQVLEFAEAENPCGTTAGWAIRGEGHAALRGMPYRVQCSQHEDNCHIMLDA